MHARLGVASQGQKGRKYQADKAASTDNRGKKASAPASRRKSGTKISQFTLFPRLPPELREMVWLFTLPNRQVIKIKSREPSEWDWEEGAWLSSCKASYNIHTALITTQESRNAARKRYEQVFAEQLGIPIWFNFAKDVLFFVNKQAMSSFHGGIKFASGLITWHYTTATQSLLNKFDMSMFFEKVKHLVIGGDSYWATRLSVLHKFQSLETLVLQRGSEQKTVHLESLLVTVKQFLKDEREVHFTAQGLVPSDPEIFTLTAHKISRKVSGKRTRYWFRG